MLKFILKFFNVKTTVKPKTKVNQVNKSNSSNQESLKHLNEVIKQPNSNIEYRPANIDLSKFKSVQQNAICPSCNTQLPKFPIRKQKCKSCNNVIIVTKLPYTKTIILANEVEGEQIKKLWDDYYKEKSSRPNFLAFGLNDEEYTHQKELYFSQTGQQASFSDFEWSLYNFVSLKLMENKDYSALSNLYMQMAIMSLNEDRPWYKLKRESIKYRLMNDRIINKELIPKMIVKVLSTGGCDNCVEKSYKSYSFDDFLKELPIPVENCKKSFCTCDYIYEFKT